MSRFLTRYGLLMVLVLFGCDRAEESKPSQSAPEEKPAAVVEEVQEKAAEKAEQAEKATEELAGEAAAKAEAAAEKTEGMMASAKESVEETAEAAGEKVAAAVESTTTAAGEAVETVKQAVSPETVVLEASYGAVTLPHSMHSEAYDCSTCHGEGVPGPLELGKDPAHALCKGCHETEGAGPTGCRDCHKK